MKQFTSQTTLMHHQDALVHRQHLRLEFWPVFMTNTSQTCTISETRFARPHASPRGSGRLVPSLRRDLHTLMHHQDALVYLQHLRLEFWSVLMTRPTLHRLVTSLRRDLHMTAKTCTPMLPTSERTAPQSTQGINVKGNSKSGAAWTVSAWMLSS